jgi:GTP-binding protein
MRITSATFVKSAFKETDWPRDSKPEIAFLGRSNVGKSSFLNSLLGVRGLARTSSTPGRTQALNFFLINEKFWFVDLPGYGYARAPKDVKAQWNAAATDYIGKRSQLVLSVHLIDARHEPTAKDLQLNEWLAHYQKPHVIVATKSDKLSNNELARNMARAKKLLETSVILHYSAVTGRGGNDVWHAIAAALKTTDDRRS